MIDAKIAKLLDELEAERNRADEAVMERNHAVAELKIAVELGKEMMRQIEQHRSENLTIVNMLRELIEAKK